MKRKITILMLLLSLFTYSFSQKNRSEYQLKTVKKEGKATFSKTQTGRVITIINKEEIELSTVQSIDDLLDFVTGIDIRQRGQNGTQADINIRGGSHDQVLILLNGINITDPQTGHCNLDIPLDIKDIDRIEILKGSASRLLGTNAFSGAINIVTGKKTENYVSTTNTAGSYGYLAQNVSANHSDQNWSVLGSISHRNSDGYKENTDFDITSAFVQSKVNSNFGQNEFQIATQIKSFGANSFYTEDFPNQFEHTKTFMASYKWNKQFGNWNNSFQTYWRQHHDRFELFRNFEGAEKFAWYKGHNYHKTDVIGGKWLTSLYWNRHKTSIGIDVRDEHIYSTKLGNEMKNKIKVPFEKNIFFNKEANRMSSTLFLDQVFTLNDWQIAGGVAGNYTKEYKLNGFGGVDINYSISNKSKVFLSVNTAIRTPNFTDLYYQSSTVKSNPNLKPEKSFTIEAGTKIKQSRWTVDASTFYRMGFDIIDRIKKPTDKRWESANLKQINALGGDISSRYYFSNIFLLSISGSYSYLYMDKKAEGFDSKYALDYLKHKIAVGLNHRIWNNITANWEIMHFVRDGFYKDFKTKAKTEYPAYALINAKLMWQHKNIHIFGNFNNLLNQSYVDYGGLTQPKFNFTAGITLKLN